MPYGWGPANRGTKFSYPTFPTPRGGYSQQYTRTTGGSFTPLPLPPTAPAFSANDTAGGAPPAAFGDILGTLLAGIGGTGGGLDPATAKAQAERAVIQYGAIPKNLGNLSNLSGAFGGDTQKLAQENTQSGLSILARINQAHADQQRYITNRLAAHGLLESGETGFQMGREQTNYAGAQQDSTTKLLDYLSGINSGVAQYLQMQALMNAIRNLMTQGPPGGGGPSGPPADQPQGSAAPPVYQGGYWPGGGTYDPYTGQFYEGQSRRPGVGQHFAE